jgi:hypothetical protein
MSAVSRLQIAYTLTHAVPASNWWATLNARLLFCENTLQARPYVVSLAALMASVARGTIRQISKQYQKNIITFFCLELDNRGYRAKDLLLHDCHFRLALGEKSWLNEISLLSMTFSPKMDCGALLLTSLDVSHNTLNLAELHG